MISFYIRPDHTNWDTILPFVSFAYNTALQSTSGFSPFFLVYGRHPPSVLDPSFFSAPVSPGGNLHDRFLSRLAHFRHLARKKTEACQAQRKFRPDETHPPVSFQPGDEVLLSTPSRSTGLCHKFLPRFIGLYCVLEQTSPVNYRVVPVCGSTDHRCRGAEIVNVCLLKPFVRRSSST